MVRSGLQQDVINMYRQGVKNAFSKPIEARPAFMLHLRYNFRVPTLGKRDYTAIEHQLRRMSRTLEMLSSPTVTRLGVSGEMERWWADEVDRRATASSSSSSSHAVSSASSSTRSFSTSARSHTKASSSSDSSTSAHSLSGGDPKRSPDPPSKPQPSESTDEPSGGQDTPGGIPDGGKKGEEGTQFEGTLPGPGGT